MPEYLMECSSAERGGIPADEITEADQEILPNGAKDLPQTDRFKEEGLNAEYSPGETVREG